MGNNSRPDGESITGSNKMSKWLDFNRHYEELLQDIYPQPIDIQHTILTQDVIDTYVAPLGIKTVLDVGCGEGFAQPMFEVHKIKYTGVCLGDDYEKGKKLDRNVYPFDFNFLPIGDNFFDLVFSRHSLEHSPFPLLTLMEWHRVAKKYLCLVLPNPEYWTFMGRNHYSVMGDKVQIRWILRRAGWRLLKRRYSNLEYQYLCEKRDRISYEGWADVPVSNDVYEPDRDDTEFPDWI